jgi:tripartite-type tricarboxylate transporter receptor subunit TctC
MIGGGPFLMVVHPSLPVTTVAELVAYLKKTPSFYGNPGVGSGQHMAAELFKRSTNAPLSEVAYKGSSTMMQDLLSGRVPIAFDNPGSIMTFVRQGQLRPIAVTDTQRFPALPNVPTMAEAGYPDVRISGWFAMLAPAETPASLVAALNRKLNATLSQPDVIHSLDRVGSRTMGGTPEACSDFMASEGQKWGDMIRAVNPRQ